MTNAKFCKVKKLYFLWVLLVAVSCTKDREIIIPDDTPTGPSGYTEGTAGILKINEFVAKGSINPNDLGSNEDWMEIYNPNGDTVKMKLGKWFVTDDASGDPQKFGLPEVIMPPHTYLIIWCDNLDGITPGNHIHSSFALSAGGESLGLFYVNDNNQEIEIDAYTYSAQTQDGYSEGRYPDGEANWQTFSTPTPGESNQ